MHLIATALRGGHQLLDSPPPKTARASYPPQVQATNGASRLSFVFAMVTWLAAGPSHAQPSPQTSASTPAPLPCQSRLSRSLLDRSLALGTGFLLANQRRAGNFEYQYDWQSRSYDSGDSQVRQAGAAWGLALIHQDQPRPAVAAALLRALRFFRQHSRRTTDGRRYIVYPGSKLGSLGTVALVALAHIDYLRSVDDPTLRQQLDEYLAFLVSARQKGGRFHGAYDHGDGTHHGNPSPYFDGESLLALVKASKYLGRSDLRGLALQEAEEAGPWALTRLHPRPGCPLCPRQKKKKSKK